MASMLKLKPSLLLLESNKIKRVLLEIFQICKKVQHRLCRVFNLCLSRLVDTQVTNAREAQWSKTASMVEIEQNKRLILLSSCCKQLYEIVVV